MDAAIINPFLSATLRLLEKTFGLKAVAGTPFIMDTLSGHRWEISGLIAITGDTLGVIAIRMHHILVNKLLDKSGIYCAEGEARTEILTSMVSELINVIGGNAIGTLTDYNLKVSVPVVIQGKNHSISWPKIAPVIGIPFRTQAGDF